MRLLMIALSMIFLASCRTTLVCNELRRQEIKDIEMCDINIKFDRCRCRMFDFNEWEATSEAVNHPLSYCDKLVGFNIEDIATEVKPKIKAMFRLRENMCQ